MTYADWCDTIADHWNDIDNKFWDWQGVWHALTSRGQDLSGLYMHYLLARFYFYPGWTFPGFEEAA